MPGRCITRARYEHVARNRTGGTGNAASSLPFAAGVIDNILGHLAVGTLHRRKGADNAYARWLDRLKPMYANPQRLSFHLFAAPCQFVKLAAALLLRRIHRRDLTDLAAQALERCFDLLPAPIADC